MDLDDFLEQQRDLGTEESEGVFTMAVEKASWKLQDYLLTTPDMFPVYLLSSAVSGGATYFRVTRSGKTDIFQFDGETYTLEELKLLSLPMVGNSAPQRIRDIGVVINVAGGGGKLRFLSDSGTTGLELKLSVDRQITVSKRENEKSRHGQTLIIHYHRDPISLDKLEEMGRLAPIETTLFGRCIRSLDDLGMSQNQLLAHYFNDGSEPLMVRQAKFCDYPIATVQKKGSGRSIAIGFCTPSQATFHGWLFVCNGVSYKLPQSDHSFPFACGVIAASDLPRDISGTGFIRSEAFDQAWEEIDEAVEELIQEFLVSDIELSRSHRDRLNLELEKRYAERSAPPEVRAYLASQGTLESPLDNLRLAGASALSTGEWESFELLTRNLRKRASLSYGHRLWEQAIAWLSREREALLSSGQLPSEVDSLVDFLQFLHEESPLRNGSGPRSSHQLFRRLLASIDSSRGLELQRRKVPLPWTAPLVLLFERLDKPISPASEPTLEWAQAFALWDACEANNFVQARKILAEISDAPNGSAAAKIWRLVLLKLYRGQMNLLESTRWTITTNFQAHFTRDASEKRAAKLLPSDLGQWSKTKELLEKTHLGPMYCPLVVSRLISLRRRGNGEAALSFLGKVLLQCSILEDGLLTAESLPDFSRAFPPKRLYGDVPTGLNSHIGSPSDVSRLG